MYRVGQPNIVYSTNRGVELSGPAGVRQYIFIAVRVHKNANFDYVRLKTQAWPTACIYLWREREGANMALSNQGLIQELKHQIP
jgi:hypothetical protein